MTATTTTTRPVGRENKNNQLTNQSQEPKQQNLNSKSNSLRKSHEEKKPPQI
jgi:hypothetical protein